MARAIRIQLGQESPLPGGILTGPVFLRVTCWLHVKDISRTGEIDYLTRAVFEALVSARVFMRSAQAVRAEIVKFACESDEPEGALIEFGPDDDFMGLRVMRELERFQAMTP